MKNILGVIPARYSSTRFPGKPLVDIGGKTMIERVFLQAKKVFDHCYVATDDKRIFDEVKSFGGNVVMTSSHHKSGTDRCREAYENIVNIEKVEFDYVVNIQGDEPFVDPSQLSLLVDALECDAQIATLVKKIDNSDDVFDENLPKVVLGCSNEALYFSRSPIPFVRAEIKENWNNIHTYYKHIGLYAYRSDVLKKITELEFSKLEKAESLEQLRWLENGFKIKVAITDHESLSIDTPEDLEKAIKEML